MSLPLPSMPLACLLDGAPLGGCGADDEPPRAPSPVNTCPGRDHGAAKRPQRLLLPSANLAPSRRLDSAGQQFLPQPLGHRPSSTTARDGLGPLFNTNACQNCHVKDGRGHPPGAGRGQRGVDAGTPVDPGRPCGRQDPVAPGGDSRADLRRPVAGRRHSRRRPGRQGADGLRADEGEVRGRHRGRTTQADPADQPARLWADASADDVFRPRRPADDRPRPARGDSPKRRSWPMPIRTTATATVSAGAPTRSGMPHGSAPRSAASAGRPASRISRSRTRTPSPTTWA